MFSDFWRRLCERNPNLERHDTRVTISVAELQRMLKKAYDQGRDDSEQDDKFGDLFPWLR